MTINPKLKEYPFIKQLFENNSEIVISMDFLDEIYHNTEGHQKHIYQII